MLVGRVDERHRLDQLLEDARAGHSGSLLLRGAPGAGKSELLTYAAGVAGDMAVLRGAGVQAEQEMPFSILHQILRPALSHLPTLPPAQREAVEGALAMRPASGADRFVVSAGVLSVLAEHAEPHGLVCLLDDAQWSDRASLDACCSRPADWRSTGWR